MTSAKTTTHDMTSVFGVWRGKQQSAAAQYPQAD
jgi:hypothetical protein